MTRKEMQEARAERYREYAENAEKRAKLKPTVSPGRLPLGAGRHTSTEGLSTSSKN